MAFPARLPRFDPAVLLVNGIGSFDNKTDEKLVLLEKTHRVTYLALQIPMFTLLPLFDGFLHEVARSTEFRVLLCVSVISVPYHAANN
jgi:hypothetical protein